MVQPFPTGKGKGDKVAFKASPQASAMSFYHPPSAMALKNLCLLVYRPVIWCSPQEIQYHDLPPIGFVVQATALLDHFLPSQEEPETVFASVQDTFLSRLRTGEGAKILSIRFLNTELCLICVWSKSFKVPIRHYDNPHEADTGVYDKLLSFNTINENNFETIVWSFRSMFLQLHEKIPSRIKPFYLRLF